MKVIIFAFLYLLLFIGVEVIAKRTKINTESSRKLVHIVAGTTAALLPLVMTFHEIIALSILFIPVMLISKRANIFSSIHSVKRSTFGEVYFPLAILLTALLFPRNSEYMYGLLVLGISDGSASIIGQKYGKKKYQLFGHKKSYAGSLAFFIATLVIGIIILAHFTDMAIGLILVISILLAAFLAMVEACLHKGLDNLIISPFAALLLAVFI